MTRIVEIDDEVYEYLLRQSRWIGEDASSILRRLLGLPGSNGRLSPWTESEPSQPAEVNELAAYLAGPDYLAPGDATDRYLRLLSFLCRSNPGDFERVVGLSGRRRKYIAHSRKEIADSGESTHPQPIPSTDFWAMTNASTDQKRRIVERVMRELGYPHLALRQASNTIQ